MENLPALPELETKRLHLRWLTEDDAPLIEKMRSHLAREQYAQHRGFEPLDGRQVEVVCGFVEQEDFYEDTARIAAFSAAVSLCCGIGRSAPGRPSGLTPPPAVQR